MVHQTKYIFVWFNEGPLFSHGFLGDFINFFLSSKYVRVLDPPSNLSQSKVAGASAGSFGTMALQWEGEIKHI